MLSKLKQWKRQTGKISSTVKTIICVGIYILCASASIYIAVGDFPKASKVDPTPFLQLEDIAFDDIDGIIKYLEGSMEELEGEFFRTKVYENNIYGPVTECTYRYDKGEGWPFPDSSVNIGIRFYMDSEYAKKRLGGGEDRKKIQLSDNIEALLGRSYFMRNVDSGVIYDSERYIGTSVRVKDVTIGFWEHAYKGGIVGQATNEAIEKLCKVLAQYE